MKTTTFMLAAVLALPAHALEIDPHVPPEINIGGRMLVTVNGNWEDRSGSWSSDTVLDWGDSSLLFGFSKYLFNDTSYGYGVFGLTALDAHSDIDGPLYPHQLLVGIGGKRYDLRLGRTALPNTLVELPTVRDHDLLEYSHVGNASFIGEADVMATHGGQVAVDYYPQPRLVLTGGATVRTEGDPHGHLEQDSFNGAAVGLRYRQPEALDIQRGLTFAGIMVDAQEFPAHNLEPEGRAQAVIAGLGFNLAGNPEATWHLDLQGIVNRVDDGAPTTLDKPWRQARADSTAAVAALRYGHRPYLQTRWQAAMAAGWKDYRDFEDATSMTLAPTFVRRLGDGVVLLAQLRYQHNGDYFVANDFRPERELSAYIGFSFDFDYTINPSVGRRNDILNLEHDMLWPGPTMGGH